jgi:hypothetical protein
MSRRAIPSRRAWTRASGFNKEPLRIPQDWVRHAVIFQEGRATEPRSLDGGPGSS